MVNEDSGENMTKNEMLEKIISELNMSVSEKKLRRMLKSRKMLKMKYYISIGGHHSGIIME